MTQEEMLKRARELYECSSISDKLKSELESAFPELKESEEEKITRTLKEIVNWGCAKNISVENNVELKDCLAWLEKQGELVDKLVKYREWLISETEQWTERENDKTNSNAGKHYCIGAANTLISARAEFEEIFDYESWPKKQYEQKSVEQNFWEKCKRCEYFDGYDICLHKNNFGSVTYESKEICKNNKFFIEKKELNKIGNKNPMLSNFFKDEYERGKSDEQNYAKLSEEESPDETKQECGSIDVSGSIKTSRIKTLENILSYFKYERKTTQKEIKTSFIPCLENLLKDVENTNDHAYWSEDDEQNLKGIIATMEEDAQLLQDTIKRLCDWLKSLKDKVKPQPKQEWSEEDEKNCQILQKIICDSDIKANLANKMSDWLKSIKSNHWKLSEEQMKTLAEWLKNHQYDGDSRYCYPIFQSLYNNIKNL